MDSFDMNRNTYSSSEQQEGDIFMELDDDATYDFYNSVDFRREAPVVDPNVGHEYLCSQPSTSENNGRKRKSLSTYPFAKKVARIVWEEQHEPLDMFTQELLKTSSGASNFTNVVTLLNAKYIKDGSTSADAPSFTSVVTVPDAKYIKDEPTSAGASSFTTVATVPNTKNFKDETIFIQRPVKFEDQSGMLLSNDGKYNSKPIISSASTFPEVNVLEEEQKQSIPKQRYSCSYVDYSKKGIIECQKCGKSFSQLNLFKQHRKKFDS